MDPQTYRQIENYIDILRAFLRSDEVRGLTIKDLTRITDEISICEKKLRESPITMVEQEVYDKLMKETM